MNDPEAVVELLKQFRPKGVRIDLGCGEKKQENFFGIDKRDLQGVDLVWDLEKVPWPLPDECAELVIASHLVEHINPADGGFITFMDEVWRILIPGGRFMFAGPYAGSAGYWQDPTHINPCTERTWAYFDPEGSIGDQPSALYDIYKPKPWKIETNIWKIDGMFEVVLKKREEANDVKD